jgi:hypothetical protein
MMRFAYGVACLLVAGDCAMMALGEKPSQLIQPGAAWFWWIPAACWLFGAWTAWFGREAI